MGKKYLDTKQNTIEASILDVWAMSSEEQKAIRNAAKMIAQEQLSKIRGNTPADQGRRAAVEDDIERAEKPNIGIRNLLIKSYWCVQSLGIFVPS